MKKISQEISFRFMLLKQFKSKWKMLRQAIDNCPEDKWHLENEDWIFSWTVCHIIETADFYSKQNEEEMIWGEKAGIDWKKDSKEKIIEQKSKITKKFLLEYMEEIELKITTFLSETTDEDVLKKDGFEWFESIYEKLIYLLRHSSHHLGELAKTLRNWKVERLEWS